MSDWHKAKGFGVYSGFVPTRTGLGRETAPGIEPALGRMPTRILSPSAGFDRFILRFAVLTMAIMFGISPMSLESAGWNYFGAGGAGPTRFHPATFLLLLTFLLITLRDGNPLASILNSFGEDLRVTIFLLVWLVTVYHGVRNQDAPVATMVDTYLVPLLMLLIFRRTDPSFSARMSAIIHAIFAANVLIGVVEFGTGWRLGVHGELAELVTADWRSTALLGHPLANALMTGCYIMILMLGGGQDLRGIWRPAMIVLQFVGMVVFGGRTSLVLLLLFAAILLTLRGFRFLGGTRISLRTLTWRLLMLPLGLIAVATLFHLGFFDKFIERFVNDNDSANARVRMLELFSGFTTEELLFGPQQDHLAYLVRVFRLEFGIESLWVAFSLYYGVIPAMVFFGAVLFFLFSVMSHCLKRGWIIFLYFFLVNSTFLGIAGKSVGFANLCMMILILLPAGAGLHAAHGRWPGTAPANPADNSLRAAGRFPS